MSSKDSNKARLTAVLVTLAERNLSIRFRVGGQSMRPWLADGDTVTVSPVGRLSPGDVVLYLDVHGAPVVHRLLRRVGRGREVRWQARGDALWRLDDAVPESRILGRVVRVERDEGRRVTDLDRPTQRILARAHLFSSANQPVATSSPARAVRCEPGSVTEGEI